MSVMMAVTPPSDTRLSLLEARFSLISGGECPVHRAKPRTDHIPPALLVWLTKLIIVNGLIRCGQFF